MRCQVTEFGAMDGNDACNQNWFAVFPATTSPPSLSSDLAEHVVAS